MMMGAMDTRNMYSDFVVNKYLHTVASCWILLIYVFVLIVNVWNAELGMSVVWHQNRSIYIRSWMSSVTQSYTIVRVCVQGVSSNITGR